MVTNTLRREDLITAIEEQDLSLVAHLIHQGIDLNTSSESGWTPLMLAILQDRTEIVELLLKNGADPNLTTRSAENPCRSPLAVAISNGRLAAVKLLVAYHATIDRPDFNGITAIELAQKLALRPFRQEAIISILSFLKEAHANNSRPSLLVTSHTLFS